MSANATRPRVYISGPMTGIPDFNVPAFNAAAVTVRALGYEPVNPADHGVDPSKTWADYMRADIIDLMTCDRVVTLPGWQHSRGALVEVYIALALGMPVCDLDDLPARVEAGNCEWRAIVALALELAAEQHAKPVIGRDTSGRYVASIRGKEYRAPAKPTKYPHAVTISRADVGPLVAPPGALVALPAGTPSLVETAP